MQIFGYTRENGGSWFSPEGGSPCRQRRLLNNSYAIECPLTVMFGRSATQRLQRKYIIHYELRKCASWHFPHVNSRIILLRTQALTCFAFEELVDAFNRRKIVRHLRGGKLWVRIYG